jgi:hypothetical protein
MDQGREHSVEDRDHPDAETLAEMVTGLNHG